MTDILERLEKSYRDPHEEVVVSPMLLMEAEAEIAFLRAQLAPAEHGKPEKLRIYINRALEDKISPNKRAAHAVHAALEAFGVHPGVKVIVLDKGPTQIEQMRTVIRDAGHTELEPNTLTAGTNWPEDSEP